MQPLLGSVRSLLVVPDVGFKLSYPVFSGPRLWITPLSWLVWI
jgi:hypothetical protein